MTKKLTFKEYYESKELLLSASKNLPKIIKEYVIKKYCKIPLIEGDEKVYIALKPKDVISITWEFADIKKPQAKMFTFENTKYSPSWSSEKIKQWIITTTIGGK